MISNHRTGDGFRSGLLTIFARRTLSYLAEDYPTINKNGCLETIRSGGECSRCATVCNHRAVSRGNIDYSKCVKCNFCSAVCPSQTISPSDSLLKSIWACINSEEPTISISCKNQGSKGDIVVYCLASLPWEIYIAFAQCKKVIVSYSSCQTCSNYEYILQRKKDIIAHIGLEKYNYSFLNRDCLTEREISRRELFSSLKEKGRRLSKSIAFSSLVNKKGMLIYRRLLVESFRRMKNQSIKVYWDTPVFNKNCWGCGICIEQCPTGALEFRGNEIIHYPLKCIQCRFCEEKCLNNGISKWKRINVDSSKIVKYVTRLEIVTCNQCGHAMKQKEKYSLCYYCGNKLYK